MLDQTQHGVPEDLGIKIRIPISTLDGASSLTLPAQSGRHHGSQAVLSTAAFLHLFGPAAAWQVVEQLRHHAREDALRRPAAGPPAESLPEASSATGPSPTAEGTRPTSSAAAAAHAAPASTEQASCVKDGVQKPEQEAAPAAQDGLDDEKSLEWDRYVFVLHQNKRNLLIMPELSPRPASAQAQPGADARHSSSPGHRLCGVSAAQPLQRHATGKRIKAQQTSPQRTRGKQASTRDHGSHAPAETWPSDEQGMMSELAAYLAALPPLQQGQPRPASTADASPEGQHTTPIVLEASSSRGGVTRMVKVALAVSGLQPVQVPAPGATTPGGLQAEQRQADCLQQTAMQQSPQRHRLPSDGTSSAPGRCPPLGESAPGSLRSVRSKLGSARSRRLLSALRDGRVACNQGGAFLADNEASAFGANVPGMGVSSGTCRPPRPPRRPAPALQSQRAELDDVYLDAGVDERHGQSSAAHGNGAGLDAQAFAALLVPPADQLAQSGSITHVHDKAVPRRKHDLGPRHNIRLTSARQKQSSTRPHRQAPAASQVPLQAAAACKPPCSSASGSCADPNSRPASREQELRVASAAAAPLQNDEPGVLEDLGDGEQVWLTHRMRRHIEQQWWLQREMHQYAEDQRKLAKARRSWMRDSFLDIGAPGAVPNMTSSTWRTRLLRH
jgi:hypothetical protein